ncbi:MAG: hypothetical protein IKL65_04240 [Bacilli bacterium]|nr:hypothetical protein [Bacilli bacterium]
MKKYSVFRLYVVEKDGHKFICERIYSYEYREVLTKEKLILEENDKVESLTNWYALAVIGFFDLGYNIITNPLMLTKKDVLYKYIEINERVVSKNIDMDDLLKRQQEELEGLKVLAKECPELAKKYSLEKLQGTGILDENGDLKEPYNEIFTKKTPAEIMSDMWHDYAETVKDDIPDIPIMSAKEYFEEQKKLEKK